MSWTSSLFHRPHEEWPPRPDAQPEAGAQGPEADFVWPEHAPGPLGPAQTGPSEDGEDERDGAAIDGTEPASAWAIPAWMRQLTFRSRLSLLVGLAVGIAVALTATVSYFAVSRQLQQQADAAVVAGVNRVDEYVHEADPELPALPPLLPSQPFIRLQLQTNDRVQVLTGNGRGGVQTYWFSVSNANTQENTTAFFPVTDTAERAFAEGPAPTVSIVTLTGKDGNDYRVATVSIVPHGLAVMIGYSIQSLESSLAFLRLMLILVAIGGVALAAAMGWAVGRASMGPVENLTLAAEHVAETQDLSAHIEDIGNDELGRLGRSFNAMLAALSASRRQQAQLVSDAGHELRTPLTSLRTNIEVLMRARDLPEADRNELLGDVKAQLEELTTLVGDLVELAREEERPPTARSSLPGEPELVDMSQLIAKAVERAQRRALSVTFRVDAPHGYVKGHAPLLERAVMNILDNAAKWSPPGGEVAVTLEPADEHVHLCVTDQGPGIAPEDLPHVFDRFYRAQSARSMPGSGLGLAIVKRVVSSHGGRIEISPRPQGGTQVDMWLPRAGTEALPDNEPEPEPERDRTV